MKTAIPKGFYIKARKIQESEIAHCPPHIREIWDWMLRNANHKARNINGTIVERGQIFTSYAKIQEDLHWMVGYRKHKYEKHHCEKSMKYLTKAGMIATRKTTRGLHITICNYDFYNNISNYERDNESYTIATMKLQGRDTIHKNYKELEKETLVKNKEQKNQIFSEWKQGNQGIGE